MWTGWFAHAVGRAAFVDHFVERVERSAQLVRKCYKGAPVPLRVETVRAACAKLDDFLGAAPAAADKKSTRKAKE